MKKIGLFLGSFILLFSCTKDQLRVVNPYLPPAVVNFQISTALPAYTTLQYPGNAVLLEGFGVNGVILINTGSSIRAYEATCSNHHVESCSALSLNGVEAQCNCEHQLSYNLFVGLPNGEGQYPLVEYRVVQNGTNIMVVN